MRERHRNDGRGRRLKRAFDALDAYPALRESRDRLLAATALERYGRFEVVSAIESDIALTCGVLRLANRGQRRRGRVDTVVGAVDALDGAAIEAFARRVPTFDFFERKGTWGSAPIGLRLHALATQEAAAAIAAEVRYQARDRLAVTSLLHDVGKLVLTQAYPGYPRAIHYGARTPQERAQLERRELGVDHAMVGGVLLERWGLPQALAAAIEGHHAARATGEAGIIGLADMLAHYQRGSSVSPSCILGAARALDLEERRLRCVMFELQGGAHAREQPLQECPLTERELLLLRRLAAGAVYKQIAHELELSASTVRTHLHNVYGKLGVVNRAQAVLIASERGWI